MKSNTHSIHFLTSELDFPPVENANPEGLLAVGGDLSSERLMLAYKNGIFPWFSEGSRILWWSPGQRMVLFPDEVKISRSMQKVLQSKKFVHTQSTCFEEVLNQCATIERSGHVSTWITQEMKEAYLHLHKLGYAKSFEVWEAGNLVGGLYGIDLGHVFCGESMFSKVSNASKAAFIELARHLAKENYKLIDCQMYTSHLESLGAREISRKQFIMLLRQGSSD